MMEIYKFNINDFTDELYCSAYNSLSPDKKSAVDRCKLEKTRKLRVAGDMLLKKALSDNDVENAEFFNNSKGKPYIKNSPFYFNISHSGDVCVLAVSNREVGADIEEVRNVKLKTALKFATQKELVYIFGKIPETDDFSLEFNDLNKAVFERFFEIWTLKEAYFKMLGTGIATDLKSVEFSINDAGVVCSKNADVKIDKSIEGYIVSLSE